MLLLSSNAMRPPRMSEPTLVQCCGRARHRPLADSLRVFESDRAKPCSYANEQASATKRSRRLVERTERDVVAVGIAQRALAGPGVRVDVRLLSQRVDQPTCTLQCAIEIV